MPNISITGAAVDGDPDPYWLNLYEAGSDWNAGEPGGDNKISRTKSGDWLFKPAPDRGAYAKDAAGNVVFFLRNLDPALARVGDTGQGHAYETGRIIQWRVDSL